MNSNGVSQERINEIIDVKGGKLFWTRFDALVLNIDPGIVKDVEKRVIVREDNTEEQIVSWEKFYNEFFFLDVKFDRSIIPQRKFGFARLILIPRGLRLVTAYTACRNYFKCWKCMDNDIESNMRESERGPAKRASARWFHKRVEATDADEEAKNKSANDLENEKIQGITLLERIVYELKYWSETDGRHLDIKSVTLCSGSRYADDGVPCACWRGNEFNICGVGIDDHDSSARSRIAVG